MQNYACTVFLSFLKIILCVGFMTPKMLLYQFNVTNKHKQSLSSTTSPVNGTNQVSKSLQD